MIWEKLEESMVIIGVEATTAEEVLKAVGDRLVEKGRAKPGYADALIERERSFPTGLNIEGMGIAIPHADSEFAIKTAIAVVIPPTAVPFRDMATLGEMVDVRVAFCLCLAASHAHVEELQCLMTLLQNERFREELVCCKEARQVIDCVKRAELAGCEAVV